MIKKKKVVILLNPVDKNASLDDQDVLVQAAEITKSLRKLGYTVSRIDFTANMQECMDKLKKRNPQFVFNLAETFHGKGAFIYLAPAMLDFMGMKYSGGTTDSIFITTNKMLAKEFLIANSIPTPPWFLNERQHNFVPGCHYIVKAVNEDASIGIDSDSVRFFNDTSELLDVIKEKEKKHKIAFFAERYIEGREFNVAVLGHKGEPVVLPPAEIEFVNFGKDRFRIIDYKAKWETESFEYENTRRRLDFGPEDEAIINEIKDIAATCWRKFGLRGYARVDFRVDELNRPWVLEINVNPCISPDGGFMAAAGKAGLSYTDAIKKIIGEINLEKKS